MYFSQKVETCKMFHSQDYSVLRTDNSSCPSLEKRSSLSRHRPKAKIIRSEFLQGGRLWRKGDIITVAAATQRKVKGRKALESLVVDTQPIKKRSREEYTPQIFFYSPQIIPLAFTSLLKAWNNQNIPGLAQPNCYPPIMVWKNFQATICIFHA